MDSIFVSGRPAIPLRLEGLRWLLHIAVLGIASAAVLMPSGPNSAPTAVAGTHFPADESVWLPATELVSAGADTPTPTGSPKAAARSSTPTSAPTVPPATRTSEPTPATTPSAASARSGPPRPQLYQVQPGDSVTRIAQRFGVDQDTILQANRLSNPNNLFVGQTLTVLPVSGLVHQVKPGESLSSIATIYGVAVVTIAENNDLTDSSILQVGQDVLVPGGRAPTPQPTPTAIPSPTATRVPPTATATAAPTRVPPTAAPTRVPPTATPTQRPAPTAVRPAAAPAPASAPPPGPASASRGTGQLAWPVAGGISQQFSSSHRALDFAADMGVPVRAAADGRVVNLEQRSSDYGWFLVIDHGNGLKTLYAHLSGFNVKLGDSVSQGQQIGTVGTTGLSTGPHLHFEVTLNGALVNPLTFL